MVENQLTDITSRDVKFVSRGTRRVLNLAKNRTIKILQKESGRQFNGKRSKKKSMEEKSLLLPTLLPFCEQRR